MKEEDLKGARSKLGLKGEVKSKTYEVMVECGESIKAYLSPLFLYSFCITFCPSCFHVKTFFTNVT